MISWKLEFTALSTFFFAISSNASHFTRNLASNETSKLSQCGFDLSLCEESELKVNQNYRQGDFICSPNKEYQFGLTKNSDLCICDKSGGTWCAGTCCTDQNLYFKLQGDGNLVVKKLALNKTIAWTSKTNIDDEVKFSLSNQGIATITDKTGNELWSKSPSSKPDRADTRNKCGFDPLLCEDRELEVNTDYKVGDFICSPDSKYQFGLTTRSQLCVCDESGETWCADSCCSGENVYFKIQMDGNLVVKNENQALWSSRTDVDSETRFAVSNNGIATIKDKMGRVIWSSSNTNTISTSTIEAMEILNNQRPGISPTTFVPGLLVVNENGLVLSKGLKSKRIARSGAKVKYGDGSLSEKQFHVNPDAGATFKASDGGFVYVSNSEDRRNKMGGVGAIRFDRKGEIVDYRMILTGTTANCGGGRFLMFFLA